MSVLNVLVCVAAPMCFALIAARLLRDVRRDWAAKDWVGILLSLFVLVSVASMVYTLVRGSIAP